MKESDRDATDKKTIRAFGRAALLMALIVLILAVVGVLAEARVARPSGELTGEAPVARPEGELTGEAPSGASPMDGHLVPIHGDAGWINRGGYRNERGDHCCGKDDCFAIPPEHVGETSEGYHLHFHGLVVPHRQAQNSEDGRYWACWSGPRLRCFFRPHRGF